MKRFLTLTLCLCCAFAMELGAVADHAAGADFPDQNIRWIVGFKPGGGFDIYSRAIAQAMDKYMPNGLHVVVENRDGSASQQAASMIYNAEPDGYTIGIWPMPGLYIPQMFFDKTYDVRKVTWLGTILREPMVLAVSAKSPFKTLQDLQKADVVRVAVTGFSGPEIAAPITMQELKIKAAYITGHKVSKESILAAMRGDADALVLTYGTLRKHMLAKDFIPILLMGDETRNEEFPDLPTATEAGYPQLDELVAAWRVIGGPPGLPADRAKILGDILWKAMHDEEFQAWSKSSKRPVSPLDGPQTAKALDKVLAQYEAMKPMFSQYIK
jgi:tripartite-type tricarboxylate transporter receptor subunit TctC